MSTPRPGATSESSASSAKASSPIPWAKRRLSAWAWSTDSVKRVRGSCSVVVAPVASAVTVWETSVVAPTATTSTSGSSSRVNRLPASSVPVRNTATRAPGLTNPATRPVSERFSEMATCPSDSARPLLAAAVAANFEVRICSPGEIGTTATWPVSALTLSSAPGTTWAAGTTARCTLPAATAASTLSPTAIWSTALRISTCSKPAAARASAPLTYRKISRVPAPAMVAATSIRILRRSMTAFGCGGSGNGGHAVPVHPC